MGRASTREEEETHVDVQLSNQLGMSENDIVDQLSSERLLSEPRLDVVEADREGGWKRSACLLESETRRNKILTPQRESGWSRRERS